MGEITITMRKDIESYTEFFEMLLKIVKLLNDKGFKFTSVPQHMDNELPLRFELRDNGTKLVEVEVSQIVFYDDSQPFRINVTIAIFDEKYKELVSEFISTLF